MLDGAGRALPDLQLRMARHRRSRPQSSLFRTHTLEPGERFLAWRESMAVFLDSTPARRGSEVDFAGEVEGYLLDDILLTRAIATHQKYDRPPAKIARDSLDHYMIQVFVGGHTDVFFGRRTVRSHPNFPIAFDLGDVLDSYNEDFDLLCVVVPRARLAPSLLRPDSVQGQIPNSQSGTGRLLGDFITSLYLVAPSLTPSEAATSVRALLELVASALNGAEAHLGSPVADHALLLKAQRFLRENLSSHDLTPDAVALAVGISRTSLYRLFQPLGGVAAYVRELRLRRSLSQIVSARHAHEHISQIAFQWGFANAAHFTRAFKQRFGRTPGEARETAREAVLLERVALDTRVGDRRYEEWIATLA